MPVSLVTPSTSEAICSPNSSRTSSSEALVSSTVSCRRAAQSVSVSSRMPAQIFATPTGWTMKSSPDLRRWSAWRSQANRKARSTASLSIGCITWSACSSITAFRSPSRPRSYLVSLTSRLGARSPSASSTRRRRGRSSTAVVAAVLAGLAAGFELLAAVPALDLEPLEPRERVRPGLFDFGSLGIVSSLALGTAPETGPLTGNRGLDRPAHAGIDSVAPALDPYLLAAELGHDRPDLTGAPAALVVGRERVVRVEDRPVALELVRDVGAHVVIAEHGRHPAERLPVPLEPLVQGQEQVDRALHRGQLLLRGQVLEELAPDLPEAGERRPVPRVVVDHQPAARLDLLPERRDGLLGARRVLHHAQAHDVVEASRGERERADVGLRDSVALRRREVLGVHDHGVRQVHGGHVRARDVEQHLGEAPG